MPTIECDEEREEVFGLREFCDFLLSHLESAGVKVNENIFFPAQKGGGRIDLEFSDTISDGLLARVVKDYLQNIGALQDEIERAGNLYLNLFEFEVGGRSYSVLFTNATDMPTEKKIVYISLNVF